MKRRARISSAPFLTSLSSQSVGRAYWVQGRDNVRCRLGIWSEGENGTILLLTGRTEYIEKYGEVVTDLQRHGFAVAVVEWRGQGLSERLLKDGSIGHVDRFTDYQIDLDAALKVIRKLDMPKPLFLLAHSMGGSIGLRALLDGLDVKAATFSSPMWGVAMTTPKKLLSAAIGVAANALRYSNRRVIGTSSQPHVLSENTSTNLLTHDARTFLKLQSHLKACPDLAIGGPSIQWLTEALAECKRLDELSSPDIPTLTIAGSDEMIVDLEKIIDRMNRWSNGELVIIPNVKHEPLMSGVEIRSSVAQKLSDFFLTHR